MTPEDMLRQRIGAVSVEIDGRRIDLLEEVAIPAHRDLEELLREQPAKLAAWRQLRAKALRAKIRAMDRLREQESVKFLHYYRALEEAEREEWRKYCGDEDEERDGFGRRLRAKERVARGERVLSRWRRNFSDDLVWAYVRTDEEVQENRKAVRAAEWQVEVADAVCAALEHRARCLSHLAALHRDLGRAG